jgi:hypothetical protein
MDKRLIITVGIVIAFLIFSYPILAAATAPPVIIEKDGQGRPTVIIEQGKGKDTGLIRVTQIHYAKGGGGNAKPPKTDTCYKLAGWKWMARIVYTLNETDNSTLYYPVLNAQAEWDGNTSKELFSPLRKAETAWNESSDGVNSILFGNYHTVGVIAVTRTWYIPGRVKTAVESDILFDTDFKWGDATDGSTVMDYQNIATHEIGHTLGLSDTYTTSCFAVTMYGYSGEGDIEKRTLETPDITGLQMIYGE